MFYEQEVINNMPHVFTLVDNQLGKEENNLDRIGYKNQPSCNGFFSSVIFILLENIIKNENLFNMQ